VPNSECPVCVAVAQGGRIRLTAWRALFLQELLKDERFELLLERREQLDRDMDATSVNHQLKEVDAILKEVDRTIEEMGW